MFRRRLNFVGPSRASFCRQGTTHAYCERDKCPSFSLLLVRALHTNADPPNTSSPLPPDTNPMITKYWNRTEDQSADNVRTGPKRADQVHLSHTRPYISLACAVNLLEQHRHHNTMALRPYSLTLIMSLSIPPRLQRHHPLTTTPSRNIRPLHPARPLSHTTPPSVKHRLRCIIAGPIASVTRYVHSNQPPHLCRSSGLTTN